MYKLNFVSYKKNQKATLFIDLFLHAIEFLEREFRREEDVDNKLHQRFYIDPFKLVIDILVILFCRDVRQKLFAISRKKSKFFFTDPRSSE